MHHPQAESSIGERLREVRKRRGLSQKELAAASGISVSLIRKLEQGDKQDTRLETVHRFAAALRVPTMRLVAGHTEEGARASIISGWEPVRTALTAPVRGAGELDDELPTVAGVGAGIDAAMTLFADARLDDLRQALPLLLRDADVLAQIDPAGRAVRVRLLQLAGRALVQTRQFDAAREALDAALSSSADVVQGSAAITTMCWLHMRQGELDQSQALATRWVDDTEPNLSRATADELNAWGWLLLRVSASAGRDNRPDEAEDALRLAQAAAVTLGREYAPAEDPTHLFGPVTVAIKRAENAMVRDQPDRVLQMAATIPATRMPATSNNRNRHLLDVANAHARTRGHDKAIEILSRIRNDSPEWLPNQRYAKDILTDIMRKRRTPTDEMLFLADAMELPV